MLFRDKKRKEPRPTVGIRQGGGGIVPAIDAPRSAVNAGERRVKVRHGEAVVTLPVLPSTTADELVVASAGSVSRPVAPESTVLLETFLQLGLERRVRRYERIRDILNSWARDSQNALVIVPSSQRPSDEDDLKASCAPRDRPAETTVYLYHSKQPGQWKKRWITLRTDGQMIVSKKADRRPKYTTNICHLSDFDVYSVTPRQASKVLKPPKKHCLAVKSQEKSSMFLSTEKYVHFFSTDDPNLLSELYRAVQSWRSWYLVNRLGEGGSEAFNVDSSIDRTGSLLNGRGTNTSARYPEQQQQLLLPLGEHPTSPVENDHRRRGIDPVDGNANGFTAPGTAPADQKTSRTMHQRNMSLRKRKAPPVSFPSSMVKPPSPTDSSGGGGDAMLVKGVFPNDVQDATFAPTGLLGRTYSLRLQAQQEQEAVSAAAADAARRDGPFTKGPSLLNGELQARLPTEEPASLARTRSVRSTQESSTATRPRTTSSTQLQPQPPKPLLDFSRPEFKEAPQHVRRGRGYVPPQPLPGGLIDAATSPDMPIQIPPATSWRRLHPPDPPAERERQPASASAKIDISRQNTLLHRTATTKSSRGMEPANSVPTRSRTQRDPHAGRGARTGDRNAQTPMLDLSEGSKFVPGSLLAKAEQGGTGSDGRGLALTHR